MVKARQANGLDWRSFCDDRAGGWIGGDGGCVDVGGSGVSVILHNPQSGESVTIQSVANLAKRAIMPPYPGWEIRCFNDGMGLLMSEHDVRAVLMWEESELWILRRWPKDDGEWAGLAYEAIAYAESRPELMG